MSGNQIEMNPHEEEGDEGDELWLISYSDLMTLLFGFFVLMYSFASVNTSQEVESVKKGVANAFGGSYMPPLLDLKKNLVVLRDKDPLFAELEVESLREGLEITFQSGMLFEPAKAEMDPQRRTIFRKVVNVIARNLENSLIQIEGHTDDIPIKSKMFPSNWELSAARSSAIAREFVRFGFDPKKLIVVGYAENRPAYPNYNDLGQAVSENRRKNRRVVLKVLNPDMVKNINSVK